MLPILRNGVVGLNGIDPGIVEAAEGVGMTPRQILTRVKVRVEKPASRPLSWASWSLERETAGIRS
jgi:ABC-type proline/glycine betaine transport system permease subunit